MIQMSYASEIKTLCYKRCIEETFVSSKTLFSRSGQHASLPLVRKGVPRTSNRDPLDLVEGGRIARAVVEFGGAWAFVRGHGLGIFERAAGFQIGGDPGSALK
jgi:hypothetical protein